MSSGSTARWKILAAAALFSTGGVAIKACSMDGWQVACLRSGFGALALAVLVPAARKRWTRGQVLVACAYASTLILFVLANKLTTAANAIFLQSTAPLYVLVLSRVWLREPIRRRDLIFMLALAIGLGLFFAGKEAPRRTATDPLLGNVLGAFAGVAWALTVSGLRWIARSEGVGRGGQVRPEGAAASTALLGNLIVFGVCLPLALPVRGAGLEDWLWIGYLGVFQIGLAYVFMTAGVRGVRALEGALLLLVEPVLSTLQAWRFHGEVPGLLSAGGALVILCATIVHSVVAARRRRPATDPGRAPPERHVE